MCSRQWLLRECACSMGPSPGSPRSPGWRWEPGNPALFPLCLVSALLDSLHIDPGDSGSSLGTCWYLPARFLFLGLPWLWDLPCERCLQFLIRCLFFDDWHSVLCTPASERRAASLSAFQALPSLPCVCLSFTLFPHFCLCRAHCRLSSCPCQRRWELTGHFGGWCPPPAPAFSCPASQEPSRVGLDLPSGVSVVPLLLGFSARGFSGCVQGFFMVPLWSVRPPSHRPCVRVILWPREAVSVSQPCATVLRGRQATTVQRSVPEATHRAVQKPPCSAGSCGSSSWDLSAPWLELFVQRLAVLPLAALTVTSDLLIPLLC